MENNKDNWLMQIFVNFKNKVKRTNFMWIWNKNKTSVFAEIMSEDKMVKEERYKEYLEKYIDIMFNEHVLATGKYSNILEQAFLDVPIQKLYYEYQINCLLIDNLQVTKRRLLEFKKRELEEIKKLDLALRDINKRHLFNIYDTADKVEKRKHFLEEQAKISKKCLDEVVQEKNIKINNLIKESKNTLKNIEKIVAKKDNKKYELWCFVYSRSEEATKFKKNKLKEVKDKYKKIFNEGVI